MGSSKELNSSFFFGATIEDIDEANLIALGIPWDVSSSYRKGCAKAPTEIRQATSSELYNPYTEAGVNIEDKWQIFDSKDVKISTNDAMTARKEVLTTLTRIYDVKKNPRLLFLGGDHLITYFSFYSLSQIGLFQDNRVGIIYLDAHPDLYYQYKGNIYSHACVLRRIIDQTKINPKNIIQVGVRASTEEQRKFATNAGITTITMNEFQRKGTAATAYLIEKRLLRSVDQIYLSMDLDILDPAFAPGLGNPEPGGLTTRDVINFIRELSHLPIFAFDIVELCPDYDISNITAFAAAKIIKEILGMMS
ncbi:MAG: agmatinase [Candidatus Heimdallarchaeota archaeon]|nr:MAG: agmatinase [Candidatus Heimdallarchaeota archaeon]